MADIITHLLVVPSTLADVTVVLGEALEDALNGSELLLLGLVGERNVAARADLAG